MIEHYVHRSGVEEANRCLRSWWYSYRHAGHGLSRVPNPNYFDLGSALHKGFEQSLMGRNVEQAVEAGLTYYRTCSTYGMRFPQEVSESERLIEALLRAWYLNGLERLLSIYKVLHVEEEVHLTETVLPLGPTGRFVTLHWQSKPDALLKERYAPNVAGFSLKSIDDANEFRRNYFRFDLQGLTEMFFGSLYMQNPSPAWTQEIRDLYADSSWSKTVDYIQTIFLVKGKRLKALGAGESSAELGVDDPTTIGDYDAGGNYRPIDSFLINRWTVDPHGQYAPHFNEIDSVVKNNAWMTRYYKPGNKSYNQLKGMIRVPVAQQDIASWIAALAADQVSPNAEWNNGEMALDRAIVWDEPVMRSDMQAEEMIEEIRHAEARRALGVEAANLALQYGGEKAFNEALLKHFPRTGLGRGCRYPTMCPYTFFCYHKAPEGAEVPSGFALRVPHHEPERLYLIKQMQKGTK